MAPYGKWVIPAAKYSLYIKIDVNDEQQMYTRMCFTTHFRFSTNPPVSFCSIIHVIIIVIIVIGLNIK